MTLQVVTMWTHGVCAADPAPVVGSSWNVASILFSTPKLQCRWCCRKEAMGFWDISDVLLIGMKQFTRCKALRGWEKVEAASYGQRESCLVWFGSLCWDDHGPIHVIIGPAFQTCLWGMSHDVSCKQLKHKGDIVATRLWWPLRGQWQWVQSCNAVWIWGPYVIPQDTSYYGSLGMSAKQLVSAADLGLPLGLSYIEERGRA